MKSADPQMRIQAIRASESLYKAKDKSFAADYTAMLEDRDANVVIQAMLTLNLHKIPDYDKMIRATCRERDGARRQGDRQPDPAAAVVEGQRPSLADTAVSGLNFSTDQRRALVRGEGIYKELCSTCHGPDGNGAPMAGAPEGTRWRRRWPVRRGWRPRDYIVKRAAARPDRADRRQGYPGGVMVPMGTNTDEWIATSPTTCATASATRRRSSRRSRSRSCAPARRARRRGRCRSSMRHCRSR